jgi:hypothetical protein
MLSVWRSPMMVMWHEAVNKTIYGTAGQSSGVVEIIFLSALQKGPELVGSIARQSSALGEDCAIYNCPSYRTM